MDKKRQAAVITGAARGMGRAFSVALAKEGIDVYGIDILEKLSPVAEYEKSTEDDFLETKKLVEEEGTNFYYSQGDIRNVEELEKIAAEIKEKFGTIDILIANAALQAFSPFIESSQQHWDDIVDTNIKGTVNTLKTFLPLMIPNKKGKVVIISSTQGMRGMWHGSAYSATKWGLVGLAKSLALEMGEYNINVNVVVPGLVDTKLTRNQKRWQVAMGRRYENKQVSEDEVAAHLAKSDALGLPWLKAEDVAPAVAFLTSSAADKITGAVYDVAGGTSPVYTS
ncbi:hypothetical protein A8C56_13590 [Niabella ginsenosidivorans]|uniref:Short-chain dehydrogenase n=1 Tax=Niabella ginsenosidivorans TaxID=1176587 RepID=A0A1A9I2H8_9BACT|nr:SDR family NAD(P)-dependent oxidoreductase [Niabella ginsenosidivorans]ANH81868.1 hypothetical protein A8C56_13590 [Niabella ginsenosidivorans]